MAKNFADRFNEQLAASPLVKETDDYMEQQVLNPDAQPVLLSNPDTPAAPTAVEQEPTPSVSSPSPQASASPLPSSPTASPSRAVIGSQDSPSTPKPKYPSPFVSDVQGSPKHCQALVSATTYTNMGILKNLYLPNMSFGAMATEALSEWVDRKIKEYQKRQQK